MAAAYAIVAGAWIVTSDSAAAAIQGSSLVELQMVKGLAFVTVTALTLYGLLRRWEAQLETTRGALGRSRQLFKALFDRLDDAVIMVGEGRKVVDCNAAVARVLGYAPEELLGGSTEVLHTDRDAFEEFARRGERSLREQGVFRTEYQLRHRDGRTLDTEHTVAVADDDDAMAISIVRDISAKKRAERLLARQGAFMTAVLGHVTDVVAVVNDQDCLEFASSSLHRILGHDPDELLGFPVMELVHPEDRDAVRAVLERARRDPGSVHRAEHRVLSSDGVWIEVESVGTTIDGDDIAGTVVSTRDVSAQRAAERALREKDAQLQQAQKLEAIGRLAGGVAHDFNNLLTVIFGFATFVTEQLPEGSQAHEDMQAIVDAAQRAAKLTEQLLLFSRQHVAEPEQIDLNETVRGTESVLRRLIGEDILFEVGYGADLPAIFMDGHQLAQVVMNLVVNARDAMPDGGRITMTTDTLSLDAEAAAEKKLMEGRYARIEVTDTGHGMDAETQARIFEPFFTTKAEGQGTGLGLSTSFGIIASAQGRIEVDSRPGEGSTFRVYLPESRQDPRHETLSERPPGATEGESILLVEDDAQVRSAAVRLLRRAGYQVTEASTPEEARALAASSPPDLLLTDVVMPGVAGHELARELIAKGLCRRVLFMSGYTPDELLRRRVAEDRMPLLRKPFTEVELQRRVQEALSQEEVSLERLGEP
ncbi:MAG: PAS domain S-box protein [Myxococcales bacterium]